MAEFVKGFELAINMIMPPYNINWEAVGFVCGFFFLALVAAALPFYIMSIFVRTQK
jgi:hypothetical protein